MATLRDRMIKDADRLDEEEAKKAATPITNEQLMALAEEFRTLRDEKDRLEAELKQVNDRYGQLRTKELPEAMSRLGMINAKGKGSFTFSGGRVHLETKLYAACTEENRPKLFEFLRKNNAADLIKETVNPQTLSAYIRERRGDGLKDPPGVSVHEEVTAKLVR